MNLELAEIKREGEGEEEGGKVMPVEGIEL